MLTVRGFVLALTMLFGLGFLTPIVLWRRRYALDAALGFGLAGSLLGAAVCGAISFGLVDPLPPNTLIGSALSEEALITGLHWEVTIDPLAAFFGLLISGFSALVAIYSCAALRAAHYVQQRLRIAAAFNLFVWATLQVVFVSDGLALLVALELMTIAFGYLALYRHVHYDIEGPDTSGSPEQRKNARLAVPIYLIVSHVSTAFLLVAVSLLALDAGSLSFSDWMENASTLHTSLPLVVFLLALAGLGIRAGLTPAHFWVSLVHPASPTPTHALSLGIAIKVAVYLMYRFFFQFLDPDSAWGYVVLLLAACTALVNVWYAIASHDLKTALAYHSIENIGIIVAPIGVAMILIGSPGTNLRWLAGLALAASLYHLLNHAVFKGLLYMATGAIDNQTGGVVELNRLGGLIKLYPWTSAAFMCGAFAIAGFPPLNGFVSEWLTLRAFLFSITELKQLDQIGVLVLVIGLVLLVTSFALTAFCFYKLVGLAILGLPRTSPQAREGWQHSEAAAPMLAVMSILAMLCLLLGLLPGRVLPWLAQLAISLGGGPQLTQDDWTGLVLQVQAPPASAVVNVADLPVLPLVVVAAGLLLVAALLRPWRNARRPITPWNCGAAFDPLTMQATGASLSDLVRHLASRPMRSPASTADFLPSRFALSESHVYPQAVYEIFRERYNRLIGWLLALSERLGQALQGGDIRRYLAYMLAAILFTLILFFVISRVAQP